MPKIRDRKHEKVGRLTVVAEAPSKKGRGRYWLCRCDCGNEVVVAGGNLKETGTRSCGCLQREKAREVGSRSLVDRSGERFGRLTILREAAERIRGRVTWHCRCECGAEVTRTGSDLRIGRTTSCGCLLSETRTAMNEKAAKHGHARTFGTKKHFTTPEYRSWKAMLERCRNPNAPNYHLYGGRGISVCERWIGRDGFTNFLADMGPRGEGLTLDRIETDGNYEPSNCRWADAVDQAKNRRKTPEYTAQMKANLDAGRTRMWNEPELRAKLLKSRKRPPK
jgi:hypothetical protein